MSRQRLHGLAFIAFTLAAPFMAAWDAITKHRGKPEPVLSSEGIPRDDWLRFLEQVALLTDEMRGAAYRQARDDVPGEDW